MSGPPGITETTVSVRLLPEKRICDDPNVSYTGDYGQSYAPVKEVPEGSPFRPSSGVETIRGTVVWAEVRPQSRVGYGWAKETKREGREWT